MKQITGVYTAPRPHWVGDGFPVRSLFSYQSHAEQLSPFLLLDYAGPHTFALAPKTKNVEWENTRIAALKPSRLFTAAKLSTAIQQAAAASSALAMCSG